MAVAPLKQEVTFKPGDIGKITITLTNHTRNPSDGPEAAHVEIVDVQVTEDGSITFPEPAVMPNSASKWLSLSHSDVRLEPNESQVIECRVNLPLSAAPGEYYSAVLVTMGNKGRTEQGVSVQYRIASGIFLTVSGRTFAKQAKISRCELLWPGSYDAAATQPAETQLPKVSVVLQNIGQARFDATGKVRILDSRSRIVFASPLASKRPCVFAGDSRLFEAVLSKPLPAGKYTAKVEMDYGSTWGKTRQQIPVEILPDQAAFLAMLCRRHHAGLPPIDAEPEKLSLTVPAGAMRSIGLKLQNISDGPVQGSATLADPAVATQPAGVQEASAHRWIRLNPSDFTISQGARKTVEFKVQVPPEAEAGRYFLTVIIKAGPTGLPGLTLQVPVDIEVKAEK